MSREGNSRFVRSAWALLLFQFVAAAVAVGVTAWAAFQVRPLLAEKERLTLDVGKARAQLRELEHSSAKARLELAGLQQRLEDVRSELKGAREATPALIEGINAFHRRQYALAIARYDEALRLNPGDAYIYNLKSYSQFKARDVKGAAQTVSRSLALSPDYDWGYFDLARYQCAAGNGAAAIGTLQAAVAARGDAIRDLAPVFLERDGEFRRLCSGVLPDMVRLTAP
jgi:tetratricopeptide (TPR) repeat protein